MTKIQSPWQVTACLCQKSHADFTTNLTKYSTVASVELCCSQMHRVDLMHHVFDTLLSSVFSPETSMQLEETVEVVTTEVLEKDRPSSPLAQSPPAESSAGPSVPASREVKNRSKNSKTSLKQLERKLFV